MNRAELDELTGRIAALELVIAQALGIILLHVPKDDREICGHDIEIDLEKRLGLLAPASQAAAINAAGRIMSAAVSTSDRLEASINELKDRDRGDLPT